MKMHLCTCEVALAGDTRNTVVRIANDAVSFPEIQMLRFLHGAEAVTDIVVVADAESDVAAEKARLVAIYGEESVEKVYPGFAPMLPMEMPGAKTPAPAPAPKPAHAPVKTAEAI